MRTYQEWQKVNPSKAGLLAACATAIRQVVPEAEVILYGSVARGEETAESDIDLLVLVPQEVTYELKQKLRDPIFALELEHDQLIALMIYQSTQWHSAPLNYMPLYRAIVREGVQV
jgi:predicted nucleotidyltransferase